MIQLFVIFINHIVDNKKNLLVNGHTLVMKSDPSIKIENGAEIIPINGKPVSQFQIMSIDTDE